MSRFRIVLAAALTASALAVTAPAAFAGIGGETKPPPVTGNGPTPDPGTAPAADAPTHGTAEGCSLVAGPNYVGASCGTASDRGGRTVKEILGEDPVPDCWQEPLTAAELDSIGEENVAGPDGYTWVWQRCLTGIDKETKRLEAGGIKISIEPLKWLNDKPYTTLTDNQQELVDINDNSGMIPTPITIVSPSYRPRVGQWVWFRDGTPPADTDFQVHVGPVTLRPHIVSIEVHPLGYGVGDKVDDCPGTGVTAQPGWTGGADGNHPACSYQYQHSSASQEHHTYPVTMIAHWQVDLTVQTAAGTQTSVFAQFQKSQITALPVTEIQTVVVP